MRWNRLTTLPETKAWRFGLLSGGAGVGVLFVNVASEWLACLVGFYGINPQFRLLLLGLPIFVLLWWFRTYDAQQQIQQANFATGITNLASGNPLSIGVGVAILLGVSNSTLAFDKEIKTAFIRRLKEFPQDLDKVKVVQVRTNRLAYAQHILKWLIAHQEKQGGKKPDLSGMDCRFQEFVLSAELKLNAILPKHIIDYTADISFEEANCKNLSFAGLHLTGYDVTRAINLNYEGAYIEIVPEEHRECPDSPIGVDKNLFAGADAEIFEGKKAVPAVLKCEEPDPDAEIGQSSLDIPTKVVERHPVQTSPRPFLHNGEICTENDSKREIEARKPKVFTDVAGIINDPHRPSHQFMKTSR